MYPNSSKVEEYIFCMKLCTFIFISIQIYYNGADLGVPVFACNYDISQIIACSPPLRYGPMRWVSKRPNKYIPILNILGIFNPNCWIFVLISIFCLIVFLLVAAKVATLYGAQPSDWEDIALVPFR